MLLDVYLSLLVFFSQLTQTEPVNIPYEEVCTLLPKKIFSFEGTNKKVKGQPLSKIYVESEAVGQCISLCANHKRCNAVNFKKDNDEENCVLIQAGRTVKTEVDNGWLGYSSDFVCMPGCYRNAGRCLYEIPITEVTATQGSGYYFLASFNNKWYEPNDNKYARARINRANGLLWFRLEFGKMIRLVRVILYIRESDDLIADVFSLKVGLDETADKDLDVKRAKYCAYDVSEYPGTVEEKPHKTVIKDIYCDGPLEGRFLYLSKYTTTSSGEDMLAITEAIVYGEKMEL